MVFIVQSTRGGEMTQILKVFENVDDAIYYASVLELRDEHGTVIEEFEVDLSTGRSIDPEKLTEYGRLNIEDLDLLDKDECERCIIDRENRRRQSDISRREREDNERKEFREHVEQLLVEYAKEEYELYKQCKDQEKDLYDKMINRECSLEDYKDNTNQMNLLKECMNDKLYFSDCSDILQVKHYVDTM